MEIRELNLAAFGPFTDQSLSFNQGSGCLYIVYGPNEAGKSSALRGLKLLLYGIPERTTDNFIHAGAKLRISGCLRTGNGQELAFVRRKGRKNTLLSVNGEPLDGDALAPFLLGVPPEVFETLFGIDHSALVQGGQEILEQRGEVGQALFSAALGSQTLHGVLEQLDQDADSLFRPRGSTQAINLSLKRYTELNQAIRERSLSSREWDEHRLALARSTRALEQVQHEVALARAEVNRLQRIQRVLPKLARHRQLLEKAAELDPVVVLPDDFGERRQKTTRELETARAMTRKAASQLKGFQDQLDGLRVSQEVLEQAENIEALHARLGAYCQEMQDRPQLDAEVKQLRVDAEALLKAVRPGLALANVDSLRPLFARRQEIAELGNQYQAVAAQVAQTERVLNDTQAGLERMRAERERRSDPGSPEALRRAAIGARKLGDLDGAIQSGRTERDTLQAQCAAELTRLTLWKGELEDIPDLPVPTRESINRFDREYEALDKGVQRLQEKQGESKDALHAATKQLDELQRTGAVPREYDLDKARSERDQAWASLRRLWVDGEKLATTEGPSEATGEAIGRLADTFESLVAEADQLSDRLRREADRVHKRASLMAEQEDAKRKTGEISQSLDEIAGRRKRIDRQWEALWACCGIRPHSPREMREWLDRLEKLQERLAQLEALRVQVSLLEQRRDTHCQRLKESLRSLQKEPSAAASLEDVLAQSEEVLVAIDGLKRQLETLDKEIKTLEQTLASARSENQAAVSGLNRWNGQWKAAVKGLGLSAEAGPSAAGEVMEKLRELFAKLDAAEKLRFRIERIDQDAARVRDQTATLVEQLAPELATLPVEETVVRLSGLLSDNRSRVSRRQQLEEQVTQARQDTQDAEVTIRTMTERLDAQCIEARCQSHSELDAAERRSAQQVQWKKESASLEQEILELGEGATLAELGVETKAVDPDALPGKIEALTRKITAELEPRQTELAQSRGRAEKELELMDGSDRAAALADERQAVLAGIRSHAERYVRVKLAARILRDEIERYRKENQGPLLKRASAHFAHLTRHSFEGLRTDFNEQDEPVLLGIRPGGQRVRVEGMSSGTRDQLYLALRLASLEKYMESAEPMPFIVDDILVDFDDQRSAAALGALAELSQKTQVILFTHHSRVVEQGRELKEPLRVQVHEL